jgi:anti-sigma factor RsiW
MTDMQRPGPDLTCDEVRDLAASFVLGALDTDEAAAVRAHLASCTDAHAEMAELASVLPVLAESVPLVEPPPALKERLLAAAAADLPVPFPSATEREVRVARRATPIASWTLRIAAVLAIALLGAWNLLLQGQLGQARTYEQNVAAVLELAGQPGSLTAVLTGEGGEGPAGLAAIDGAGLVKLAMRDLAPTQGDEVYTTWIIGQEAEPVRLGDVRVDASGTAYLESQGRPAEDGIVLALTLEPRPGATAPSSTPVSAGTASAAS